MNPSSGALSVLPVRHTWDFSDGFLGFFSADIWLCCQANPGPSSIPGWCPVFWESSVGVIWHPRVIRGLIGPPWCRPVWGEIQYLIWKEYISESVISFSPQDCLRAILISRKMCFQSASHSVTSSDAGYFVSFGKGNRLTINSCMRNGLV